MKAPIRVAVTGAAGQIAYSVLFRIARGDMLGRDQPIILQLLDLPVAQKALAGVAMELDDCAFPVLEKIIITDDPAVAFKDVKVALLIGARPRSKGMERKDLLEANGAIFSVQGKALNDHADRDVKVLVVGNPANTNALIAMRNAPDLNPRNFTAMLRLDHNRSVSQIAQKLGCPAREVGKVVVWGNHSSTQDPDLSHVEVRGRSIDELLTDKAWVQSEFVPKIQQRGAAIIEARGLSSAASAASAAIDHIHDWVLDSRHGDWVTMGVPSDGSYGIPKGIIYGFPVTCRDGDYEIVQNVSINEDNARAMKVTLDELLAERSMVEHLLG